MTQIDLNQTSHCYY